MADRIGYYSPETAQFILQVVNELVRQGYVTKSGQKGLDRWTPTATTYATATTGIPVGGSELCLMKRRGDSGLEVVKDNAGGEINITVHNDFAEEISAGSLIVAAWTHGKWIAISAGSAAGSGSTIIFEIVTQSGVPEAASNDCTDQLKDGAASYMAHVRWRPCGLSRVPEETDDGLVEVFDPLEAFFKDRENSEIQGRMGIATYMVEDGGYDCQWVVTFIDWFREIQIVHDVIHTEEEIRFKIKKIKTWDDCDLPDVVIPLIDCRDES